MSGFGLRRSPPTYERRSYPDVLWSLHAFRRLVVSASEPQRVAHRWGSFVTTSLRVTRRCRGWGFAAHQTYEMRRYPDVPRSAHAIRRLVVSASEPQRVAHRWGSFVTTSLRVART